jgi:hypothetical protein
MTENATPTPTDAGNEAQAAPEPDRKAGLQEPEHPSREAAKYRTRLRAAEATIEQRDAVIGAMRDEVERLHRREVERAAAGQPYWLKTPGDLWLVTDLADMLDDDGRLSETRVKDALGRVAKDRPDWTRAPDLGQGARGGGIPPQREASFGALLKGRR